MMASLAQIALRAAALAVLGAAVGVGNHWTQFGAAFTRVETAEVCEAPDVVGEPVALAPGEASSLCTASDVIVLDVRSAELYAAGHIADAEHLPCTRGALRHELAERLHTASAVIVYGQDSEEALAVATSLMQQNVHNVHLLEGGYPAWEAAGLACSSGACPGCDLPHPEHL
jgi:rhodanese-related sulfurtransferase